jgi:hypothetical protein
MATSAVAENVKFVIISLGSYTEYATFFLNVTDNTTSDYSYQRIDHKDRVRKDVIGELLNLVKSYDPKYIVVENNTAFESGVLTDDIHEAGIGATVLNLTVSGKMKNYVAGNISPSDGENQLRAEMHYFARELWPGVVNMKQLTE